MSDNTANINVNVNSKGSAELRKDAEATSASYKGAVASLEKIAASNNRVASPVANARMAAKMENQEYGVTRSAVGTGAAARDFAQQAQGLGGLVHLYATFAANIFAVSAAFTALSKAADTTNMVKGLDQLGASSGKNLGSLAKAMSIATDGALSLRDSLEAVGKTSAAGLSNKQILELSSVAKSASQALGVSMPDAISRLSRGISKIEPELLDELGLFTKVDTAVTEYARSVGKAATSLTDFERRQAFAIAVLKEGKDKFSSIDIDANPYSKLLASLSNTAQKALEIFNSILGPFAKILAENTGLLSAALSAVVIKLISSAVPAISRWRQGLHEAALEAKKNADTIVNSYGERFVERTAASFKIPSLRTEYEKAKKEASDAGRATAEARSKAMSEGLLRSTSLAFKELKTLDPGEILSDKAIKSIQNSIKRIKDTGDNEELAQKKANLQEYLRIETTKRDAKINASKAFTALQAAEDAALEKASGEVRKYGQEWQRITIARKATAKAERLNILSEVEKASNEGGFGEGIATLTSKLNSSTVLGPVDKFRTYVSGAFTAVTSAVTTFLRAFSNAFMYIGIAITVFELLNTWLDTTVKEAERTASALEDLAKSSDNLGRTLDVISKKDPLAQLSLESVAARSTAIASLAESMSSAFEAAYAQMDKMSQSNWATFKNFVSKLWGGDIQSKLNENLATAISTAFKSLRGSDAERQAAIAIKNLLKYSEEDTDGIEKALNKLSKTGIKEVISQFEELRKKEAAASATLNSYKESQTATIKAMKDLLNSFLPQDNIAKVGQGIMTEARNLGDALSDPINKNAALIESLKNLSILSPEVSNNFAMMSAEIKNNAEDVGKYNKILSDVAKQEEELRNKIKSIKGRMQTGGPGVSSDSAIPAVRTPGSFNVEEPTTIKLKIEAEKELEDLLSRKEALTVQLVAKEDKLKAAADLLNTKTAEAFDYGTKLVSSRIAAELAKAGSTIMSGIAGIIGDSKAGILLKAEAEQKMLNAQIESIKVQIELAKRTQDLEAATRQQTLTMRESIIQDKLKSVTPDGAEWQDLEREKKAIIQERALLKLKEETTKKAFTPNGLADIRKQQLDSSEIDAINRSNSTRAEKEEKINDILKRRRVLQDSAGVALQFQSALANISALAAQKYVAELNAQVGILNKEYDLRKKSLDNEISLNKDLQARASLNTTLTGQAGIEAQIQLDKLKIAGMELNTRAQVLDIDRRIAIENKAMDELKKKFNENDPTVRKAQEYNAELVRSLMSQRATIELNSENAVLLETINSKIIIIDKTYAELYRLQDLSVKRQQQENEFFGQYLDLALSLVEAKKSAGFLTEKIYIREKNALEILKTEQSIQNQIYAARTAADAELLKLKEKEEALRAKNPNAGAADETGRLSNEYTVLEGGLKAINVERDRINTSYDTTVNKLITIRDKQLEILEVNKKSAEEAEKWRLIFEDITTTTENLSSAFGKVGDALGKTIETFAQYAKKREENLKKEKDLQEQLKEAKSAYLENPEIERKVQKELDDQKRKGFRDELTGIAATASASKKMFSEKTAAFKVLSAVEKAASLASLAAKAADFAMDIATLPAKIAAGVGQLFAQGGFAGFPASAAFLALMAGLGAASSVNSTKNITKIDTPDSKQQQETQGTGSVYKNVTQNTAKGEMSGLQKLETAYGVFGDIAAKSNAIKDSLEVIQKTSIEGLPLFNQMVSLLTSIDKGVNNASQSIYTSSALRTGSAFSNINGTSSSINVDSTVRTIGTIALTILGGVVGNKLADKILGGIFGSTKITSEVEDWGILLADANTSFSDLINKLDTFKSYVSGTTTTTKKGALFGLFGGNSTTTETFFNTDKLDVNIASKLQSVFQNAQDLFIALGTAMGRSEAQTLATLNSTIIKDAVTLSIKDLKGEDLEKELSAVISTILNVGSQALFSQFTQYAKYGEDLTTTVIRVFDTNEKVAQAFKNIGIDLNSNLNTTISTFATLKEQSISITESLVDMAGGTDIFLERAKFFQENFLNKDQQLKNTAVQVQKELDRLGLSTIKSRDQLLSLVNSLNMTDPASQQLYTNLMKLAPAFAKVFPDNSKLNSLRAQTAQLEGDAARTRLLTRNAVLDGLTDDEKALQNEIYALQDAATLRKLDTDLLNVQGKSYEALIRTRQDELAQLVGEEKVKKQLIYDAQDATIWRKLEIDLLTAQGKSFEALTAQRQDELKGLSEEQKIKKQAIYTAQDDAVWRKLEIELLSAQGLTYTALLAQRQDELKALSAEQKIKKQAVYDAQDAVKTQELQIELLNAEGKTYSALQVTRAKELKGLSDTDQQIKLLTYSMQDLAKTTALMNELDTLRGDVDKAIINQRDAERLALKDSDKIIYDQINAEKDYQTLRKADIELMEAQGHGYKAMLETRKLELNTLTSEQRALKTRVYAAQDMNKSLGLYASLARAAGKETDALNIERKLELNNYSEADQAILKLTWAYTDQADAIDKLKTALESISDEVQKLIDYKKSLLLGDLSTLTTANKFKEAQNQIEEQLTIISKPANTDAEKQARSAAVDKITQLSDQFLGFARTLYSSSPMYTQAFGYITGTVDKAISGLQGTKTEAQRQLEAAESSVTKLGSIDTTLKDAYDLLDRYLNLPAVADRSVVIPQSAVPPSLIGGDNPYSSEITPPISRNWMHKSGTENQSVIDWNTFTTDLTNSLSNTVFGTTDTNYTDNVSNLNDLIISAGIASIKVTQQKTSDNTGDMLEELRKLNTKIDILEAAIIEGESANIRATNTNANTISEAFRSMINTEASRLGIQNRIALV